MSALAQVLDAIDLLRSHPSCATDSELMEMEQLLLQEGATDTPAGLAVMESMGRWMPAKHLLAIDQALMDTVTGRTAPLLIIDAPPRHGKSELISKYLPAWYLGKYPERRVILASYEANFARSWGRKAREVLNVSGPEIFGVQVSDEQNAAIDWETNKGGGMVTAGVGGPMTGRGANLLVIDDPIKNAEEAVSQVIRDNQWDWWQSTARTRLEPRGCAIVMATRWHEDDLTGRLLKAFEDGEGEPIRHISFPAIAEETDYLGRALGEPLWPERWPLELLEQRRTGTDIYWWLALYQQRPGRHERCEWPDWYFADHIWAERWPHAFDCGVMMIDPSKGKNPKKSDYSAIVFLGLNGGHFYVDAEVVRVPAEELVERSVEMWRNKYRFADMGIESNSWQDLLAPIIDSYCMKRNVPPIPMHMVESVGKKELRIRRLGPHLANKRIRLRRDSQGCRLMLQQLREFPLSDHDDGPDALEGAFRLLNNQLQFSTPVEEYITT